MFVVTVTFTIAEGQMDAFLPLMLTNSSTSAAQEPGCRQFDVCRDPAKPNEVFLYEVYDDRAAFDAHMATAHFKTFAAATADMIAEKDARSFSEIWQ